MDTRSIIEASATVITITRLKPGDVYKRLEPTATPPLIFGVVQDVLHNGSDAAITAVEISSASYSGLHAKLAVFDMTKDLALFASKPSELAVEADRWRQEAQSKVDQAQRALEASREQQQRLEEVLSSANLSHLTEPEYVIGSVVRDQLGD